MSPSHHVALIRRRGLAGLAALAVAAGLAAGGGACSEANSSSSSCGTLGEICCNGTTCSAGLTCGGGTCGADSGGTDASWLHDASSDAAVGEAEADVDAVADAPRAPDGAPLLHRPVSVACPVVVVPPGQSGPDPSCTYEAGTEECASSTDCTGGLNGRCLPFILRRNEHTPLIPPPPIDPCAGTECVYDQCETDSQCAPNAICDCLAAPDLGGNFCGPVGTCRVDSDCGDGGYCSPGASSLGSPCGLTGVYFCHSSADTCVNDSDCGDAGRLCMHRFDAGGFSCLPFCPPPL